MRKPCIVDVYDPHQLGCCGEQESRSLDILPWPQVAQKEQVGRASPQRVGRVRNLNPLLRFVLQFRQKVVKWCNK